MCLMWLRSSREWGDNIPTGQQQGGALRLKTCWMLDGTRNREEGRVFDKGTRIDAPGGEERIDVDNDLESWSSRFLVYFVRGV